MMNIVDTHVHVWDIQQAEYPWLQNDTSILNQTWKIEQLEEARQDAGITSGILVQAGGNLMDTDLMLETAKKTGWIKGVVCWLPLTDIEETAFLLEEQFLMEDYFVGVRHQIHDEKDSKWLLQPDVIENLKKLAAENIPYDVVAVHPAHIETALEVAHRIPELRMVFDHLSQPPISTKEKFGRWGELMKEASQHKNFHAKISGLGTASGKFANRQAGDIQPYIEFALNHFGVDRCFCGGDWPVSMLAGSYTDIWNIYKEILQQLLTKSEQQKVLGENAHQFYNIQVG
jgi:L-fuconolactonase